MRNKAFLYFWILIPVTVFGQLNVVEFGTNVTEENISRLASESWEYAYASRTQERYGDGFAISFLLIDSTQKLYSISRNIKLFETNYSTKTFSSYWPLARWKHEPLDEELLSEYSGIGRGFAAAYGLHSRYRLGCLPTSTLRYGDLEGDGVEELILLLGPDLVVFSLDQERIVFSLRYATDNWMDRVDTDLYFEDFGFAKSEDMPYSQWEVLADLREPDPSFRGYGKVFIGDYDGDDHRDLLVWRKLYRSNMRRDGIDGFHLLSNTFFHFERDLEAQVKSDIGVTGEYLPRETSEEDILSWLAENDLTWSKGYPSLSECPGEEGQLIPEMHDPLLNDPEVFQ